jgi:hypothetical protein
MVPLSCGSTCFITEGFSMITFHLKTAHADIQLVVQLVRSGINEWNRVCVAQAAFQPALLVPVVACAFQLLLVSVVARVLPRALLCAAIAALCNTQAARNLLEQACELAKCGASALKEGLAEARALFSPLR